jgi:hypothetical protein
LVGSDLGCQAGDHGDLARLDAEEGCAVDMETDETDREADHGRGLDDADLEAELEKDAEELARLKSRLLQTKEPPPQERAPSQL